VFKHHQFSVPTTSICNPKSILKTPLSTHTLRSHTTFEKTAQVPMDGSTVVFTLKVGELAFAESRPFGGRVPTQESSQQSRTLSLPTHIILGAAKHSATRSFRPNSQHATSGSAWIFDAPNPRQVAVRKQLKVSFSSSCAPLPPARPSGCVGLAGHRLR
jgi:hypothetical protein